MEDALRLNANPRVLKRTLIGEDLALYEMRKSKVLLNKPNFIGVTVLELSKSIMYEYSYMVLKRSYGSRLRFLYTDTDSLIFSLESKNIQEDMSMISDTFNDDSEVGFSIIWVYSCFILFFVQAFQVQRRNPSKSVTSISSPPFKAVHHAYRRISAEY